MNRADDETDNLFRNHFAGELDPLRGQAARAFDRGVTGPMRRRLRRVAVAGLGRRVGRRVRAAVPLAATMAACCAAGYYVPRWLWADPPAARELAGATPPAPSPAARDDGLLRPWQRQVESASFVDPRTQSRTEFYTLPVGPDGVLSGRQ